MENQLVNYLGLQDESRGTSTHIGRAGEPVVDKRLGRSPRGERDSSKLGLAVHRGVDDRGKVRIPGEYGPDLPLE